MELKCNPLVNLPILFVLVFFGIVQVRVEKKRNIYEVDSKTESKIDQHCFSCTTIK